MENPIKTDIQIGFSVEYIYEAAELYYYTFADEFNRLIGSKELAIRVIGQDMHPEYAIVAFIQSRVVGFVCLYTDEAFVDPRLSTFMNELGVVSGFFRYIPMVFSERQQESGQLLLNGVGVHPLYRRQGIGTQLLEALFYYAREQGYQRIRLDVVDTNTGARRLYERFGFSATHTRRVPPVIRRATGFGSVTTMIKHI